MKKRHFVARRVIPNPFDGDEFVNPGVSMTQARENLREKLLRRGLKLKRRSR
ncbi:MULTISPECIES: hypothetical protein [Agarivorans]|uniref:hypothetical protein n=1 Tax=Agarivorans TaxID=261825 RepID=UPI001883D071|nr:MULTISPECIES: hypothetical protein [Agarivorans]UQN44369.1 hypothetical protein LQZ07_07815 [Agarivorans sp. B2Z047]